MGHGDAPGFGPALSQCDPDNVHLLADPVISPNGGLPSHAPPRSSLCRALAAVMKNVGADYGHVLGVHRGTACFLLRAEVDAGSGALPAELLDSDVPLAARSIRLGVPILVTDSDAEMMFRDRGLIDGRAFRSGISLPLWNDGAPQGVAAVYSARPGHFIAEQVQMLSEMGRLAEEAFRFEHTNEAIWREAEIRGVLLEISRLLASQQPRKELAQALSDQIEQLIPFQRLEIAALSGTQQGVRIAHTTRAEAVSPTASRADSASAITDAVVLHLAQTEQGILLAGDELRTMARSVLGPGVVLEDGCNSLVAAPLRVRGAVVGGITLLAHDRYTYAQEHLDLLQRVAREVSGPIANLQVYEHLQRQCDVSATIAEIGRTASSRLEPEQVMAQEVERIRTLIPFDRVALESVDMASRTMTRIFAAGVEVAAWHRAHRPLGAISEKAIYRAAPVIRIQGEIDEDDGTTRFHDAGADVGLKSVLAVPLIAGGEPVGAMAFRSRDPNAYGPREAELATRIAQLMASHMDHAALRRQLERQRKHQDLVERLEDQLERATDVDQVLSVTLAILQIMCPVDAVAMRVGEAGACDCEGVGIHEHRASFHHGIGSRTTCQLPAPFGPMDPYPLSDASSPLVGAGLSHDEAGHNWLLFPDATFHAALAVHWVGGKDVLNLHDWFVHQTMRCARYAMRGLTRQPFPRFAPNPSEPALKHFVSGSGIGRPDVSPTPSPDAPKRTAPPPEASLTERELAILVRLARGLSNVQIGADLNLSAGTVNNRLGMIYKRLGVASRTAAVAAAIKARLLIPPDFDSSAS